jgi:hypothetical protein|tara:strand:+ start:1224 stop:1433 length:210 start_codon:yes stop_codon:yes gene_type:complete
MFLFSLPLLLFASAPDGYRLLNCEEYDWISGGINRSSMTASDKLDIRFAIIEQTDPTCFELEVEDAKAD